MATERLGGNGALARAVVRSAVVLPLVLASVSASAQRVTIDPFVTGTVTWTSNANFGSGQASSRVAAIRQLSPHMLASLGVRWEALDSNVRSDATELAAFIGALYRF
jgi:hypothetical protein